MNKTAVITLGGLAVLWYINNKQTLVQSINLSPTGIETGGTVTSPTITVDLIANNPSSGTVEINRINANIIYNGVLLGTISQSTPITINAYSNTPFKVPINISDFAALNVIYQVLINGKPLSFDIVGTAQADLFTIPLNITYTP